MERVACLGNPFPFYCHYRKPDRAIANVRRSDHQNLLLIAGNIMMRVIFS